MVFTLMIMARWHAEVGFDGGSCGQLNNNSRGFHINGDGRVVC